MEPTDALTPRTGACHGAQDAHSRGLRPIVCAIGTTDPWNAAGLGLAVRSLAECGARPLIVVAAVSAQDQSGVKALHGIPVDIVRAQLDALSDAPIRAYRIGALPNEEIARTIATHLKATSAPVVYDPVYAATAGGAFADASEYAALVRELLPRTTLITPNLAEARLLTGRDVRDSKSVAAAAQDLVSLGARAALVKGGDAREDYVRDVLYDGATTTIFESPRIKEPMRGTGCLLADATAAALARNASLRNAIEEARAYVQSKIREARELGTMRVAD